MTNGILFCPTFPFNCLFICSFMVKRLLCPFKSLPLFESKAMLVKKCYTIYQTQFSVNKRKKKHFSQFCSFMKNYCLCLKLIPLVSSCFLRNCSLTNVFSFSGIFSLSVSVCSLGVSQRPLCVPMSLCLHSSSSFCASVTCFSLTISVSTSLSLSSSLASLDLSLSLSHSSSLHTQPPAASISSLMGYTDFPVFKNILFPLSVRSQALNT